jgi:hypothetical protein
MYCFKQNDLRVTAGGTRSTTMWLFVYFIAKGAVLYNRKNKKREYSQNSEGYEI